MDLHPTNMVLRNHKHLTDHIHRREVGTAGHNPLLISDSRKHLNSRLLVHMCAIYLGHQRPAHVVDMHQQYMVLHCWLLPQKAQPLLKSSPTFSMARTTHSGQLRKSSASMMRPAKLEKAKQLISLRLLGTPQSRPNSTARKFGSDFQRPGLLQLLRSQMRSRRKETLLSNRQRLPVLQAQVSGTLNARPLRTILGPHVNLIGDATMSHHVRRGLKVH
jgi:hypothetical protein